MPVRVKKIVPEQLSFELFIQESSGDNNFEKRFVRQDWAAHEVEEIRKAGGYWTTNFGNDDIFVPWHRVEFARIHEVKEKVNA